VPRMKIMRIASIKPETSVPVMDFKGFMSFPLVIYYDSHGR
jgi:hypothetical protein